MRIVDGMNIQKLRIEAAERVKDRNVYTVAEDMGITPVELNAFLLGVLPSDEVLERVQRWVDTNHELPPAGANTEPERQVKTTVPSTVLLPEPEEYRAVDLDDLREHYRHEVEKTSYREVEERTGVSKSSIEKFVNKGTRPHPRVRRLLAIGFLAAQGQPVPARRTKYGKAVLTLLDELPDTDLDAAFDKLLDAVQDVYADAGRARPSWFHMLRADPDHRAIDSDQNHLLG
jgi:transcriptional regulator with XRE-family HTH domain